MIVDQKEKICGLLGKTLGHSFSPQIHSLLADYRYSLFEISEDELEGFVKSKNYHALNVTIPYKQSVIPHLDVISDEAQKIGAVNVIKRLPDGKLLGDNTDMYGFIYMIKSAGIDIKNKKVLILGSGGSSRTATVACTHLGASEIHIVSRKGELNYDNVYKTHPDAQIIVNTTPVGMYPENGISPIELSRFKRLCGVADIVYNPQKTALILEAEKFDIPRANGLSMLVAQAKRACEIFTDSTIPDSEIQRIKNIIAAQTSNIILVGMPGCGKTTIGVMLAKMTGRTLIDTDSLVVEMSGRSIPDIFELDGEEMFRQIEHRAIEKAGKMSGVIIATGGGVPTRSENYYPLHQNGKIFFITRDISELSRDGRPLSLSGDLSEMYKKRLPFYKIFSDFEVENTTPEDTARKIINMMTED